MKSIKIVLVVLALLSVLLISSSPAGAKTTRIYYTFTGGDQCDPVLDPPHISGPNMHLHGTYACRMEATDMDGNSFPMRTGQFTWTDCNAQVVGGHLNYSCKTSMITDEGGVWEGSFVWTANGKFMLVQQGGGLYEGMHAFEDSIPAEGINQGYIQFNK